jgi:hypothetical protein
MEDAMSRFTAIAAAAAAATTIAVAPASAGYDSYHHGYRTYQPSYSQHHYKPTYQYHQPSYQYHHYKPTYYKPHYEPKKVEELCFKWTKDGYGHATKVIIPCPVEKVVIKKEIEKKVETEQPVEQQPTDQAPAQK